MAEPVMKNVRERFEDLAKIFIETAPPKVVASVLEDMLRGIRESVEKTAEIIRKEIEKGPPGGR